MLMECKHCVDNCCMNQQSDNYGMECKDYDCMDMDKYFDRTEEVLYRYLRLEQKNIDRIYSSEEFDAETKRYLGKLYGAKVELLEELIKELYG